MISIFLFIEEGKDSELFLYSQHLFSY
jgi:hypothetical protein